MQKKTSFSTRGVIGLVVKRRTHRQVAPVTRPFSPEFAQPPSLSRLVSRKQHSFTRIARHWLIRGNGNWLISLQVPPVGLVPLVELITSFMFEWNWRILMTNLMKERGNGKRQLPRNLSRPTKFDLFTEDDDLNVEMSLFSRAGGYSMVTFIDQQNENSEHFVWKVVHDDGHLPRIKRNWFILSDKRISYFDSWSICQWKLTHVVPSGPSLFGPFPVSIFAGRKVTQEQADDWCEHEMRHQQTTTWLLYFPPNFFFRKSIFSQPSTPWRMSRLLPLLVTQKRTMKATRSCDERLNC